jgi:hypothetical protein
MKNIHLLWHDYRYFPYERVLAQREAAAVYGKTNEEGDSGLGVRSGNVEDGAKLTYFKAVQNGTAFIVPDQAKLEASGNGNGTAWDPVAYPIPSLRRQSTRYSAHGLHEYRGKFNPQVVRAIGNLMGLAPGAWVLDPFCGSGTTLLESAHIGWNAIGVDVNPLGELIANSKVAAFNVDPSAVARECDALARRLKSPPDGIDWRDHLPEPEYLEKWFPALVLPQLHRILRAIENTTLGALRDVFRVVLSDICREVSLQDPGDLRIRRRKAPAENYPAVELFVEAVQTKVASVVRARQHVHPKAGTVQYAIHGDSKDAATVAPCMKHRGIEVFDAAITSPPYASAMPYLDTQRLSLSLLGLIGSRELRSGERRLIGNREIQDKERLSLEGDIRKNAARLPGEPIKFCRRLLRLADDESHGFRRRNVPALAYKYLAEMGSMFEAVRSLIRPKGRYALVVGRNSTSLRGEEVLIDTPALLASVAESRGWDVEETMAFDTYHRYDIHAQNSIREEVLLMLRRPS